MQGHGARVHFDANQLRGVRRARGERVDVLVLKAWHLHTRAAA